MKIQVTVFWVVKPCNYVVGYQHFGETCLNGVTTQETVTRLLSIILNRPKKI
jgi:hypothetical protein